LLAPKAITLAVSEALEQHGYDGAVSMETCPEPAASATVERLRSVGECAGATMWQPALVSSASPWLINYDIPSAVRLTSHRIAFATAVPDAAVTPSCS